jgi:hypothetical protein
MDKETFYSKIERIPESGCWIWTGSLHYKGYGMIAKRRGNKFKPTTAHRESWEMHKGPIPAGLFVLHRCDVRCCVNPNHLFVGTAKDNTHDMIRKGRARLDCLNINGPRDAVTGRFVSLA